MIDALLLGSIVFFFLLLFFLGFSLFYFSAVSFSNADRWFVRLLLYLGAGLGMLCFFIIAFDVLGIPLDYKAFFALSILCPLHFVFFQRNVFLSSFKEFFSFPKYSKKEFLCIGIVYFAAALLLYTFLIGAFAYPYLEDDDPWEHAIAVRYIAQEKTYYQLSGEAISHYLEPYPPTYDAILALLYQINGSVFLTLKVFNTLLIALGILFFFVFALDLFGLETATVATLILVALPSWISHFIWSHTLALVLFFPALTFTVRGFSDSRYIVPAIVLIAAMMVAHPFVSILFGIFFISIILWNFFFVFLHAANKKTVFTTMNPFTKNFLIGFFGVLLSFLYWGQQVFRHGIGNVLYSHTGGFAGVASTGSSTGLKTAADLYINPVYGLFDFLIAPIITKIDQPTGFGVVVFVLLVCSVVYLFFHWRNYFVCEKFHFVVLLWLLITFLGLLGGHLPFSILTHRFWAYVSIPLSLLVAVFLVAVFYWFQSSFARLVLFIILFLGIFGVPFTTALSLEVNPSYNTTMILSDIQEKPILGTITAIDIFSSWQPKKIVETSKWPPGVAWSSIQELEGYMWMHDTLFGKRVLSLCKEEKFLIGFDLETNFPSPEMNEFRKNIAKKSKEEIVEKAKKYDYLSLEYSCVKKNYLTEKQLNTVANALDSQFSIVFMNDEIVVYQVRK